MVTVSAADPLSAAVTAVGVAGGGKELDGARPKRAPKNATRPTAAMSAAEPATSIVRRPARWVEAVVGFSCGPGEFAATGVASWVAAVGLTVPASTLASAVAKSLQVSNRSLGSFDIAFAKACSKAATPGRSVANDGGAEDRWLPMTTAGLE